MRIVSKLSLLVISYFLKLPWLLSLQIHSQIVFHDVIGNGTLNMARFLGRYDLNNHRN